MQSCVEGKGFLVVHFAQAYQGALQRRALGPGVQVALEQSHQTNIQGGAGDRGALGRGRRT